MCALIAELMMLVGGLYALFTGKLKLTKGMSLEGRRARIAGLFLASPLPLAFLAGLALGFLVQVDILPADVTAYSVLIELGLILFGLIGAVVYARATEPKAEPPSSLPPAA